MGAYLTIFNAAWTAIKNVLSLFGIGSSSAKPDENTQAVEVANKSGRLSADEARMTREQTETEMQRNDAATDADLARVRSAGSLRDGQDAVADAIARSRAHPGADS